MFADKEGYLSVFAVLIAMAACSSPSFETFSERLASSARFKQSSRVQSAAKTETAVNKMIKEAFGCGNFILKNIKNKT